MPKNPLLSVKNLSIETKKKKLVKNISFEINKGQIFALVGESGSGKSLTALSILDLLSKGLTQQGILYSMEKLMIKLNCSLSGVQRLPSYSKIQVIA